MVAVCMVALACAGTVVAVGARLGSGAFDPSSFLGAEFGQQAAPDYDTAYDVDRADAEGEANMDADDPRDERSDEPNVQVLDALTVAHENPLGSTAYELGDSPTDRTLATGGGRGEALSGNEGVKGPLVSGDKVPGGTESGDLPGGGPDPDVPRPVDPAPDVPLPVDPDPSPTLPDGVYEGIGADVKPFPSEGLPTPRPDAGGAVPDFSVYVYTEDQFDDPSEMGMERIYRGMMLDDWKLLCSAFFYVEVDGDLYRLQGYGDNFKVGSYPATVDGDSLEVEFSFRLNDSDPWLTWTVEFPVNPCKVVVKGWEATSTVAAYYPAEGEGVDLESLYGSMLPEGSTDDPFGSEPLRELFSGWSEAKGGPTVGLSYTPTRKGRIELVPLPLSPVPEGFEIAFEWGMQTLVGYTGDARRCSIPEGVLSIDLAGPGLISADIVRIPSSLRYNASQLQASLAYEVAEGNTAYRSEDGLLIDTQLDALIGIPVARERVAVPDGVDIVVVPERNAIRRFEYAGDVDGADLALLRDAEIVVPEDRFLEFLAAWGAHPGNETNRLMLDSGEVPECAVEGDAVLSIDGSTLYLATPSAAGVFVVPDGVRVVAEGAFAKSPNVTAVVLPSTVAALERGSLQGSSLERALFEGAVPPRLGPGAFDGARAQVRSSCYAAYADAWAGAARLEANDFSLTTVEGFSLLRDAYPDPERVDETIVLDAPADIAAFTAASLDGVEATAIDARAFSGCELLSTVELPASVKSVGQAAFSGLESLETFVSLSTDVVRLGSSAFFDCPNLRWAAFNARRADAVDWRGLYGTSSFAPIGASGYREDLVDRSCDSYELSWQNGGTLLYGTVVSEEGSCPELHVLGASTSVSGHVRLASGTSVIGDEAFSECRLTGIDLPEGLAKVGSGAFYACEQLTGVVSFPASVTELRPDAFTDSGVGSITFCGPIPPRLVSYEGYVPFEFSFGDNDFRIELVGEAAGQSPSYIDAWKRALSGYDDSYELAPEEDALACDRVRKLLGVPKEPNPESPSEEEGSLEDPDDTEDFEAPEGPDDADALADDPEADGARISEPVGSDGGLADGSTAEPVAHPSCVPSADVGGEEACIMEPEI